MELTKYSSLFTIPKRTRIDLQLHYFCSKFNPNFHITATRKSWQPFLPGALWIEKQFNTMKKN